MAATFQDILSSICSQVSQVSETEFQQIFALGDSKEAKLAYDILLTSGFDVKLYNETETAKLYISRPTFSGAALNTKLDTANALAVNFKAIKLSLDQLNKNSATGIADYAVTFVNGTGNHKQIAISLIPTAIQAAASPRPVVQQPAAPTPGPQKMPSNAAPKKQVKKTENEMFGGPQISREYSFASKASRGPEDQRKVKNFMSRLFVQHVGSNATLILGAIFGVLAIVSLIIASRSFFCPDFAVESQKQNHSVFCKKSEQVDEDKNKIVQ